MKLRIRGNSIRLRLTKTEVANLAEQIAVEEITDFGNGQSLVYAIVPDEKVSSVTADFQNGRIEILIPSQIAKNWAESEEVGISTEENVLKIMVEKDFTCLTPRNAEEDADTFPHPKSDAVC